MHCSDDQFNRAFKYFTKRNQRASFVTSSSPYREKEGPYPVKFPVICQGERTDPPPKKDVLKKDLDSLKTVE